MVRWPGSDARQSDLMAATRGVDGYILDLDGTVYRGDRAVPGAGEAIAALRGRGRRVVFASNNPLRSRAEYARKLTRLGIAATEGDVVTSSWVAARHLAAWAPGAKVLPVGERALREELEGVGLRPVSEGDTAEWVIAAFDRTLTYAKLNAAFQALRRGARFVATNPDRSCPVEGGEVPDAAGVIAFLEATSGRSVEEVFGKPSPRMVEAALGLLGLPPQRCIMAGDRLETDVVMAKNAGMRAVLVLTGVTSRASLGSGEVRPDHVLASIAELPDLDRELNKG
ncbi:MAG: Phosphoglycolate phosphatase [Candidatus Bipolaricaulis sibiricus]|uniref:Phosphoglycolate phosphatase n=1 Tax=Bipolaricaulis sibiricus TaxID=2501609 RepID=A0A410FW25_BIPS1|nr:MAG: Phosphoglycolate phosphatase [Candidatus Bipolaricaulis sibiricus]